MSQLIPTLHDWCAEISQRYSGELAQQPRQRRDLLRAQWQSVVRNFDLHMFQMFNPGQKVLFREDCTRRQAEISGLRRFHQIHELCDRSVMLYWDFDQHGIMEPVVSEDYDAKWDQLDFWDDQFD